MTRPMLVLGALAAACVGTLLWCAWLILAADLPRGATVASWALWLLSAAAVVTLLAYLREFLRHREAVGREASWKPLPGLVLLWVGGVTALASFAFVLPDRAGAAEAQVPEGAGTSMATRPADSTPADAGGARPATTPASRSTVARTTPPTPVSTVPEPTTTTGARAATSTSGGTPTAGGGSHPATRTATTSSPSSTSSPLIGITLPPAPH